MCVSDCMHIFMWTSAGGKKNYFESPILIGRGATRVQWSACSESPCTCDLLPGRAMVVVNNQLQQKNYD